MQSVYECVLDLHLPFAPSLLLLSLDCFKSDIMLHAKAQGKKLMKSASEVDVNVFVLPHSYLACKMY